MSKPPKKKLKQSSLVEAFKKQGTVANSGNTVVLTPDTMSGNRGNICKRGKDNNQHNDTVKEGSTTQKEMTTKHGRSEETMGMEKPNTKTEITQNKKKVVNEMTENKQQLPQLERDRLKEITLGGNETTKEKEDRPKEITIGGNEITEEKGKNTTGVEGTSDAQMLCEESHNDNSSQLPSTSKEPEEVLSDSQHTVESSTCEIMQDSQYDPEAELEDLPGKPLQSTPSVLGESPSLGILKEKLRTTPSCSFRLPLLQNSPSHTVLFKIPHTAEGTAPQPFPTKYADKWDNDHVRMPCSPESLYPISHSGKKDLALRWYIIQSSLHGQIRTSWDLEEAILSYNSRYSKRWDFGALHVLFTEVLAEEESKEFFEQTLPKMAELALRLPELCTKPLPLLVQKKLRSITMSQQQAACLLANAFFCTFPRRNSRQKNSEFTNYPEINFNNLFMGGTCPRKREKLKCIIHYFTRVTKKMPTGAITFRRQLLRTFPKWEKSVAQLKELHITAAGTIEDDGAGMLQVDFANKYVGGGVLGRGCVQEEIRFMICPEMILSRLFTEVLEKNECLIMTGCERFSNYKGYADSFEWDGNHEDKTKIDAWGRKCTEVVAIDALIFRYSKNDQFREDFVERELNKAYCGFLQPGAEERHLSAVATGNWGCGAFGGNVKLKALIQLMAAAEAKRDMCYFTFNDYGLRDEVYSMHKFIGEKELACSDLWALINQYSNVVQVYPKKDLYNYIYGIYNKDIGDSDEDSQTESEGAADSTVGSQSPDYPACTP